jgi:hypothetical protein
MTGNFKDDKDTPADAMNWGGVLVVEAAGCFGLGMG